jgi:hypothetical protein
MPSNDELLKQAISQHTAYRMVKDSQPERELVAKAKVAAEPQQEQYGLIPTVLRKGVQGATMQFGDEIAAGGRAGLDYLQGKGFNYDQRLAEERQMLKAMDEQHPVASTVAEIGGSIASPLNLAPGGGLVAGALKTGAQAALSGFGAGEGGAENRASKALQEGVAGAATSAAFSLAGKGISKAFSKDSAGKAAARALGGTGSQYQDLKAVPGGPTAVGQKLLNEGLVKGSDDIYQAAEKVKAAVGRAGQEIKQFAVSADQAAEAGAVPSLNPIQVLDKAFAEVKKEAKNSANLDQIRNAVRPKIDAFMEQFVTPSLKQGGTPKMSYEALHDFQASLGAAYDGLDNAGRGALKAFERGLSKQLEAGLEKAAKAQGSDAFTQYMAAKQSYRMLALAKDAVQKGMEKADQRSMDWLSKGLGGGAIGALAWGRPDVAGALAVGAVAKNRVLSQGPNLLASMLNKGADVVQKTAPHAEAAQQLGRATLLETLRQLGGN